MAGLWTGGGVLVHQSMVDRGAERAALLQRRGETRGGATTGMAMLAGTARLGMKRHSERIYMKHVTWQE